MITESLVHSALEEFASDIVPFVKPVVDLPIFSNRPVLVSREDSARFSKCFSNDGLITVQPYCNLRLSISE